MIESRHLGRSFLAVLSGYLALSIVIVLLTPVAVWLFIPQELLKQRPVAYTDAYIISNFVYSFAAGVLGGWVTARMAPRSPFPHGAALAGIMAVIALGDIMAKGTAEAAAHQPSWYGWAITLTTAAGALAGGWLRARQVQQAVTS
ncbi:MAG: hypothetical protein ABI877_12535 [Gemmatimonadaceae bacterium]